MLHKPVKHVETEDLSTLAVGGILFLDSGHIAMPGSDVDWIMNRLLPTLPAGVLVHIHDIFLPDPYSAAWDWRGYNEQLVVADLMAGGRAVPVFSSHFMRSCASERTMAAGLDWITSPPGSFEYSLWLELARVQGQRSAGHGRPNHPLIEVIRECGCQPGRKGK